MDLSGIQTTILKEYASSKGLLFENHLYGCFTLLEQRIDTSDVVLDCSFELIGVNYGFFKDERAAFQGSKEYRSLWTPLLTDRVQMEEATVDELEDVVFDAMRDASATYFTAALETGELPEAILNGMEALFVPTEVVKKRRLPRTRSKRAVTPIHRLKGLGKTRRQIRTNI
jgi:hypothetical protein